MLIVIKAREDGLTVLGYKKGLARPQRTPGLRED